MENRTNLYERLLFDDSFQDYVLNRDPVSSHKWMAWITENPEHKEDFEKAKEILKSIKIKDYELSKEKFDLDLTSLRSAIKEDLQKKRTFQNPVFSLQTFIGRVAAAVIILIAAAGIFYFISLNGLLPANNQPETTHSIKKISPKGTKTLLSLRDGTKVKLNSESSLEYDEAFGDTRIVHLKGEAFFEVTRDSLRPFIIYSNNLEVKVLGTSFNVKAYDEDESVEVAVATGLVAVKEKHSGEASSVYLNPTEKAIYSKSDKVIETSGFDAEVEFGWRNGLLVFKNAEFERIIKELERWYGVEINSDEDIKIQKGYTGKFHNETLKHVLDGLSFSLGFQYSIDNEKVKIFK